MFEYETASTGQPCETVAVLGPGICYDPPSMTLLECGLPVPFFSENQCEDQVIIPGLPTLKICCYPLAQSYSLNATASHIPRVG